MIIDKEFKNPSNKYRPIPFWSWNDLLDTDEIKYQIKELKKSGVGGYFMHARSGLKTEYLKEDWWKAIEAGIEGAREEGLDAWAYDEEGWPSGFAGGIVPAMSPDFHAKFMTLEKSGDTQSIDKSDIIALYVYDKASNSYKRLEMEADYTCKETEELLAVRKHVNQYYVDTLNKRAIEAFIQCTHQAYYDKFGESFGREMHGFFTDEPRLICNNFGDLAWSDDLPETFSKKTDYDILDYLPSLFMQTGDYEKYRYDFWETVSEMFANNYMKTIYDWCEEHNCKATGHIMMEESIFSQMTSTAGVMPFYEYLHVPGIDWLRRMISSPVIGKQVGSVACQLGRKQVLTESFALCGWNVSFEELKWIAEWQFVNGVNQICQHLMAYDIKGVRKRDYPPSHFTQQTWWEDSRIFNDYLSRLCVALSEGDQSADVLMLHPMRSGYVSFDGTRTEEIKRLDSEFEEASYCLSGEHISYHYGDESIIKKYGSVKENKFVVGRISYGTVIMPLMYVIDKRTLELLLEFINNGGTVLRLSDFPSYTNGAMEDLEKLNKSVKHISCDKVRLYMEQKGLVSISITQNGKEVRNISYQQRDCEADEADMGSISRQSSLLFLVNHDQENTYNTKVKIIGKKGSVMQFICESGEIKELYCEYDNDNTVIDLTFLPMQSYMLLFKEGELCGVDKEDKKAEYIELKDSWRVEEASLNSMTLDYCRYRIDGGEWIDRTPVIKLQKLLLELQRPCVIEMEFDFDIEMDIDKNNEIYVVIEDAKLYDISINGNRTEYKDEGFWKDKTFNKVNIKPFVQGGKNTINLKTDFKQPQKVYDVLFGEKVYETEINKITYDIEIESIYLLGDFSVMSRAELKPIDRKAMVTEGDFVIKDSVKELSRGDFTSQGLMFFAGDITLSQSFRVERRESTRYIIKLDSQRAPLIKVYVNGELVKNSIWAPYEADVTDYITDDENILTLKVFASNRNLLGPHHHISGECYNVGPESFTGRWSWVERESEADATEIFDRNKNYWTDTYCFVQFGV